MNTLITAAPRTAEELVAELERSIDARVVLANHWYTDADIYELEQAAIFQPSWGYVCPVSQLAQRGDFVTTVVGRVPVVLTRTTDGIKGYVNVCRHRGCLVAKGEGNRSNLQCYYHGWTWDLDGQLKGVPRGSNEENFDKSSYPLVSVQVDTWGPLVFVNISGTAGPLTDIVAPVEADMASRGLTLDNFEFRVRDDVAAPSNWKLVIDNMMECYHCPTVHPTVRELYKTGAKDYYIQSESHWSYQRLDTIEDEPPTDDGPGDAFFGAFHFYFIYPNLLVRFLPNSMVTMTFEPEGPGSSRLRADSWYAPGVEQSSIDQFLAYFRPIWEEDVQAVTDVHLGQSNGFVGSGPLLLDSEILIQDFQRMMKASIESWMRNR